MVNFQGTIHCCVVGRNARLHRPAIDWFTRTEPIGGVVSWAHRTLIQPRRESMLTDNNIPLRRSTGRTSPVVTRIVRNARYHLHEALITRRPTALHRHSWYLDGTTTRRSNPPYLFLPSLSLSLFPPFIVPIPFLYSFSEHDPGRNVQF